MRNCHILKLLTCREALKVFSYKQVEIKCRTVKFYDHLLQQMLHGTHYIGQDILAHFGEGETWRKVFGPFFVYLNSTTDISNAHTLWADAKQQVRKFDSILRTQFLTLCW